MPPRSDVSDPLREQAKAALELARAANANLVVVEIESIGVAPLTRITVSRREQQPEDGEPTPEPYEHVEVRQGPKSKPRVVLAVPASWLT